MKRVLRIPAKNSVVYERCPKCENEVELAPIFKPQTCPSCGEIILPCSLCVECVTPCLMEVTNGGGS